MRSIYALLLNLLLGLNVFILFFLFFESRIAVPTALQVFGRAHPLFLHFPIVLLVLAWLLGCFGHRLDIQRTVADRLVHALLLASAWSAAITVVAGLLLSKEGGYEGSGFFWHKWTGIALCFLSTVLLWYHQRARGRAGGYRRVFLAGLTLSLMVLLMAGHFGAGLTHGEDYLFEPLRRGKQKVLDVETAIVFQNLVYPILEAKCLGCHSSSKAKGGLVLADTASMLKGGEGGPALVRGSVEESLLIERLLLDLDHEHRMPPKGKPQLTPEELALINAWVASGADFNIPLSALPSDDTIRRLAVAVYGPPAEAVYDFPPADAATIAKLNTPYRVVSPVAHASPALAASFYGRASYTKQSLEELAAAVGKQVVSLTLSGMPLSAGDREALQAFSNLRELLLNDTPVDDTWGKALAALPELRAVSLSSTGITEAGLAELLSAPALRTVYVWNTDIGADALEKLGQQYRNVHIERGYVDDGSTVLPLNDPRIAPANDFFRDSVQVVLSHPVSGVELRYTLDGSEPDSARSEIYKEPLTLRSDAVVRVRGYKEGWHSSREISRTFHRSGYEADRVFLLNRPNPRYRGREATALTDMESGGGNHADGKWLGYHGERMAATMHFGAGIRVDTVGISVKQDYRSHIYPPEWVEIWGGADSASARLLSRFRPELYNPDEATPRRMVTIPVKGTDMRYVRVEAAPFVPIPKGYPAEGNPAWIFLDEIIVR